MTEVVTTHVDSYVYRWDGNRPAYLLLKRPPDKHYGHLWQGVAGQIKENETAVQATIRELQEETGLEPVRMFTVDYVSSFYQSHNNRMHLVPVFGIEVSSVEVELSDEHESFQWCSYETAGDLLSWRQQKEALKVLHEMVISNDERMKWSMVSGIASNLGT